MPALLAHTAVLAASKGSFLIKPGIGLMIWTLLVFVVTMCCCSRLAFPRISEALDKRQRAIEESIDTAERTREEADKLLAEYRERLKEARAQAEEIVQRARQAADSHEHEAQGARPGADRRGPAAPSAKSRRRRERALDGHPPRGRRPDDDCATEKVTRKTLDRGRPAAARRGGAERARLLRLSSRRSARREQTDGGARPGICPRRCSRSHASRASSTSCASSSAQFADALEDEPRAGGLLLLALLLHRREAGGPRRGCSTAPTRAS